jgi:hypothetical protein
METISDEYRMFQIPGMGVASRIGVWIYLRSVGEVWAVFGGHGMTFDRE